MGKFTYSTEDNRLLKLTTNLFFIFRKILFSLVIASIIFSCGQAPSNNTNSNSSLVENVITEEILTEEILTEEVLTEEILAEEVFTEFIVFEEILQELVLTEDIIIEDYIVEYSTVDDLLNNKLLAQSMVPDIDWKTIKTKYAIGTSVIVFTAVLSVATSATPVACVFVKALEGSVKGALSGAVVGAAIAGGIEAIKSKGDVNSIKKYALESSADGFMWGAIFGAVSGGLKGYKEYKKSLPHIQNGGNELAKNIKYPLPNGGIGKTDNLGRIKEIFQKELKLVDEVRSEKYQAIVRKMGQSGDHGGHIIAKRFGGSPNIDNMVPMSSKLNNSAWKVMENMIAKALANGEKVTDFKTIVKYIGKSKRPSGFEVSFKINGKNIIRSFTNPV